MQHVADWLEKLGMSEYAQRFAENRIDFSVLPDLTDQDLEKLGVVLGDRRKMLRAIAAMAGAPAAVAPAAPVTTYVTSEPGPHDCEGYGFTGGLRDLYPCRGTADGRRQCGAVQGVMGALLLFDDVGALARGVRLCPRAAYARTALGRR